MGIVGQHLHDSEWKLVATQWWSPPEGNTLASHKHEPHTSVALQLHTLRLRTRQTVSVRLSACAPPHTALFDAAQLPMQQSLPRAVLRARGRAGAGAQRHGGSLVQWAPRHGLTLLPATHAAALDVGAGGQGGWVLVRKHCSPYYTVKRVFLPPLPVLKLQNRSCCQLPLQIRSEDSA